MSKRWHYMGDVNLCEGGAFIQEGDRPDYCNAVQVTPCSDAGGPDNWYWIESGTVYLGNAQHVQSALKCCDTASDAPQWEQGYAVLLYAGIDCDSWQGRRIVQIGAKRGDCDSWQWDTDTQCDIVLRGNTSLRRYVRREYLS